MCAASIALLTGCPSASDTFYYPYQGTYRLTSLTKGEDAPDFLFSTDSYIEVYYSEDDTNPLLTEDPQIGIMTLYSEYHYYVVTFFSSEFTSSTIYPRNNLDFDFLANDDVNYLVYTDAIVVDGEFADSLDMRIGSSLYFLTFTLDKTMAYSTPQK